MATTIKSTALDFNAIKNNLKAHFASSEEFADYNFEASGLNNLLDVLAYNTHYNGLTANFALNESFLNTAQLRSSVISIAESLGYIPGSMSCAIAVINISLDLSGISNRPQSISLPSGVIFYSELNGITYTFRTRESLTATDDGDGNYNFLTSLGSSNINLYEGTEKSKTFIIGKNSHTLTYIIPDETMDITTLQCFVYESPSSSTYTSYTNVFDADIVNSDSHLYYIKEAPNGYFEMSFGDGSTLGTYPSAGEQMIVSYLSSVGTDANTCSEFSTQTTVTVDSTEYEINISTAQNAAGGSEKEDIESIRKNAPYQFSSQNRFVTVNDYEAGIRRNFSSYIQDIKAYGGERATEPKFGTVLLSIIFNDNLNQTTITNIKNDIRDLVSKLAISSFTVDFIEPLTTYLEVETYFQYSPTATGISKSGLESLVNNTITSYFSSNTGNFDQSFRKSNMLTVVDDTSSAIFSSRSDIKIQQRIVPTLTVSEEHTLRFPQSINLPQLSDYTISSSLFRYRGKVCKIVNKLGDTKLQIILNSDNSVISDNIGYFTPNTGIVNISGLTVDTIVGNVPYIKISVSPANGSSVISSLNNVLEFDTTVSFSTGIITTASN